MKKVQFSTTYDYEVQEVQVEVIVNGEKCGFLEFDHDQNVWVLWPLSIDDDGILWPVSIDDGVSYSDDLAEAEEAITDEIKIKGHAGNCWDVPELNEVQH